MSNSEIEQSGTVKGHLPNEASLSGRISNGLSLSGHISIGGAGDFIIKMTVTSDDYIHFTVTSCDATFEQIEAAVSAEKRVVLVVSFDGGIYELPMVQGVQGSAYCFGTFFMGMVMYSTIYKEDNSWSFVMTKISAYAVDYSNDALPNVKDVEAALDALVPKSHTHANKSVLDKFAESDGKPTYDGEAIGGGASDFIIKMTVTSDDNGNYTVTSCDTTVEQIDAAVANEKRVVLIATDTDNNLSWDIPIVQGFNGSNYYFATFILGQAIISFVQKIGENEARWQFMVGQIGAEFIGYSNDALPNHISTVGDALNELVPKSHTHTNKPVLDKFAESDGKPTYDGKKISGASTAEEVEYTNAILPDASNVKSALDDTIDTQQTQSADLESLRSGVSALIDAYETQGGDIASLKTQAHTHSNKGTLDKLSDSNGKLQYNGSDVGLKGDKGDTPVKGTDYWTESDKAEIVADTLAALPTWTGGSY